MQHSLASPWRVLLGVATLAGLQGCATPAPASALQPVAPAAEAQQPAAAADIAPAAAPAPAWVLQETDKTLKAALERWSQAAGWRLLWELGVDYRIVAAATVNGSFEDAVSAVVRNLEHAEVPPRAVFYRGNQVLRVVARGME